MMAATNERRQQTKGEKHRTVFLAFFDRQNFPIGQRPDFLSL